MLHYANVSVELRSSAAGGNVEIGKVNTTIKLGPAGNSRGVRGWRLPRWPIDLNIGEGEVLLFTLQIDFYSLVTESVSMLVQST